jgi:hypothetical protein
VIFVFTSARDVSLSWASLWTFHNKIQFYGEELAPRPTPKQEDHPLSVVRDCLFNIFATTLRTGGRSYIRNPSTQSAVMTGTHFSRYIALGSLHTAHCLQCNGSLRCTKTEVFWKVKFKHSHYKPRGFQEVEAPRLQDSRNMKVLRVSALRTGHLYSFILEAESTPGP